MTGDVGLGKKTLSEIDYVLKAASVAFNSL